jgi:hypothetical protein
VTDGNSSGLSDTEVRSITETARQDLRGLGMGYQKIYWLHFVDRNHIHVLFMAPSRIHPSVTPENFLEMRRSDGAWRSSLTNMWDDRWRPNHAMERTADSSGK